MATKETAKVFDMPIVLSTVGVGFRFNGPTVPSLVEELEGIEPIDRASMNAFEDEAFSTAVAATGRKGKRLAPGTYLLTVESGGASARTKLWVLAN